MAVIYENLGSGLMRAYSDSGVKIHGGFPESDYDLTYFPEDSGRTYVETNIPVDRPISEQLAENDGGPKQYSKVKILLAAQEAGFVESLIEFIESDKTIEYIWNASNVIEDNELLANYMPVIGQVLGKNEEQVRAFLDEYCLVD